MEPISRASLSFICFPAVESTDLSPPLALPFPVFPDCDVFAKSPKLTDRFISFLGRKIPVVDPKEAPSPRKLIPGTHIDFYKHQAPYVVQATYDIEGNLCIPKEGNHFRKNELEIYVFYLTNDEGVVQSVYYGYTDNADARLNQYKTGAKKAVRESKERVKLKKVRLIDRALAQTPAENVYWGIITRPSSLDSMYRHERRLIQLAKEYVKENGGSSGNLPAPTPAQLTVLNVAAGKIRPGPITTPSPVQTLGNKRSISLDLMNMAPAPKKKLVFHRDTQ